MTKSLPPFIAFLLCLLQISCSGDELVVAFEGDSELDENEQVPFALYQNYPNPFNGTTTIRFDLAGPMQARLAVYTEDWYEVAVLFDGPFNQGGGYAITFDAVNLPNGIYYYRMDGAGTTEIRPMRVAR
jgi:hypothetical protein